MMLMIRQIKLAQAVKLLVYIRQVPGLSPCQDYLGYEVSLAFHSFSRQMTGLYFKLQDDLCL
jgi:hypothetical protein